MSTPAINGQALTDGERGAYGAGDGRGRRAYLKRHGSPAMSVDAARRVESAELADGTHKPSRAVRADWVSDAARVETMAAVAAHGAAWMREHGAAYDAAGERGGRSAVKALHMRHIKAYDAAVSRAVCPATGAELERVTAARDAAVARLEVLGLVTPARKPAPASRKPAARTTRKPAVKRPAVPESVPAPMPAMTRAARKASNRELAAAMRAAGIAITTESWAAAKAGTLAGLATAGA